MRTGLALAATLLLLPGCSTNGDERAAEVGPAAGVSETARASRPSSPSPSPEKSEDAPKTQRDRPVVVRYMLVRRATDRATADFEEVAESTLSHPRGWERADFELVRRDRARYRVVLAEGEVVDRLCLPYETYGTYSCQNGPVVALNADRWRHATPKWTGNLLGYKRMLVNHEFGHLLGQHHPEVQCPKPGRAAPIMAQQSTELNGCLPNPWPLPWEIELAARHKLPLAPGYGE